MTAAAALALLLSLQAQVRDPAGDAEAPAPLPKSAPAALAGLSEADSAARLRDVEARLSTGQPLTQADQDLLLEAVRTSPHASVRALAAAVLPWLDPVTAVDPLLIAIVDPDARVKSTAAQSLTALARRLPEVSRKRATNAALLLLDDPADEVACNSAELLSAIAPSVAVDALRARAETASDVRYACFSRYAGLPLRSMDVPPMPPAPPGLVPDPDKTTDKSSDPDPDAPPSSPAGPVVVEPATNWLFVALAAGAGTTAGAFLPGSFVPARDVLVYRLEETSVRREELSVGVQVTTALLGGAAFGGAAWAADAVLGPLSVPEAAAVGLGTGSAALAGLGAGLMLDFSESPMSITLSSSLAAGVAASAAWVYLVDVDANDDALVANLMAQAGLAAALGSFAALPVGVLEVGSAKRADFGFGIALASAGAAGLAGLAASPLVDLPAGRVFAATGGGLVGASLLTGLGFLVVPANVDVRSRIACGLGLTGQLVGATAAFFLLPDSWVGVDAVAVFDNGLTLHAPTFAALPPAPQRPDVVPVGAVLQGTF